LPALASFANLLYLHVADRSRAGLNLGAVLLFVSWTGRRTDCVPRGFDDRDLLGVENLCTHRLPLDEAQPTNGVEGAAR
jgi:hypothetical protein